MLFTGLLILGVASVAAASLSAQSGPFLPSLPVLVAALDSTVRIETYVLDGSAAMVDAATTPNVGGYRIVGPGPVPRVTLARRLIPIVERASDSKCGVPLPSQCEFQPRFAFRFLGTGTPLELLVSKDCTSFAFVRGRWHASHSISDGRGGYLKDADGRPMPGLGRSTAFISDSLLAICNGVFPEEHAPQSYSVREAYEVYSAILPSAQRWASDKAKCLIILTETTFYQMCLQPDKDYEELLGPAIADYVSQNEKQWRLVMALHIDKPYEMVSKAGIDSLFAPRSADWKNFYERYPDWGMD